MPPLLTAQAQKREARASTIAAKPARTHSESCRNWHVGADFDIHRAKTGSDVTASNSRLLLDPPCDQSFWVGTLLASASARDRHVAGARTAEDIT